MYKVSVDTPVGKKCLIMTPEDQKSFLTAVDLMQHHGQIGMPCFKKSKMWRVRIGNVRIFFKLEKKEIILLDVLLGFDKDNYVGQEKPQVNSKEKNKHKEGLRIIHTVFLCKV